MEHPNDPSPSPSSSSPPNSQISREERMAELLAKMNVMMRVSAAQSIDADQTYSDDEDDERYGPVSEENEEDVSLGPLSIKIDDDPCAELQRILAEGKKRAEDMIRTTENCMYGTTFDNVLDAPVVVKKVVDQVHNRLQDFDPTPIPPLENMSFLDDPLPPASVENSADLFDDASSPSSFEQSQLVSDQVDELRESQAIDD